MVGNVNDIFKVSQARRFANEDSIPLVKVQESSNSMPSRFDYQSPNQTINARPVVARRNSLPESLPLIESASTFSEQTDYLAMHIRANLNKPDKIKRLVSEWVELIIENDSITQEFQESANTLTKSELIELVGVLASKLY